MSQIVVMPEELAVKSLHGSKSQPASPMRCRENGDFDATVEVGVRPNGPQDVRDRVGEYSVEQILELAMSQDRKDLGSQESFRTPR
jgi:hypothetical protein